MAKNRIKFKQLDEVTNDRILGRIAGSDGDIEQIIMQNDPSQALDGQANQLASAEVIKDYIDSKLSGLAWKDSVRLGTVYSTASGENGAYQIQTGLDLNDFAVDNDGKMTFAQDAAVDATKLRFDGTRASVLDIGDRVAFLHGFSNSYQNISAGDENKYNGIWEVERREHGNGLEIEVTEDSNGYSKADYVGTTITIDMDGAGGTDAKVFIVVDEAPSNSGNLDGSNRVKIAIDGLNGKAAVAQEIQNAILGENAFSTSEITTAIVGDKVEVRSLVDVDMTLVVANAPAGDFIDEGAALAAQTIRLIRSQDASSYGSLVSAAVFIEEGAQMSDTAWVVTSNADAGANITAGKSNEDILWSQFSALGRTEAGKGLSKSGMSIATISLDFARETSEDMVALNNVLNANAHASRLIKDVSGLESRLLEDFSTGSATGFADRRDAALAMQQDPLTMVYLNGVLLKPAATVSSVLSAAECARLFDGASGDGDYYFAVVIDSVLSGTSDYEADFGAHTQATGDVYSLKIILSEDVASAGDRLQIIMPTQLTDSNDLS